MRAAGRDGTKLFGLYFVKLKKNRSHFLTATTHGWVNVDFMLDVCLVGFLVPEPSIRSAEDEQLIHIGVGQFSSTAVDDDDVWPLDFNDISYVDLF